MTALFLFAHQDDEFGVFAQIEIEVQAGNRVYCVYATDGSATANPARRNIESLAVLRRLGVASKDVVFLGEMLAITDGRLYEKVNALTRWLKSFLATTPSIDACYVPAWEGGHPDHDLLHAVAVSIQAAQGKLALVRQYPLYNRQGCLGPFFRVLSPLPGNGAVERWMIPWRHRVRYIRLCLAYPSQWRSWVGLFPLVCWHYFFDGTQALQATNLERLRQPPHAGVLYYERRSFYDWPSLRDIIDKLIVDSEAEAVGGQGVVGA